MSSSPVFSGVRATRSLDSCACFVDRYLSFSTFSFGHCVALDLWILSSPMVSSNSSYILETNNTFSFENQRVHTLIRLMNILGHVRLKKMYIPPFFTVIWNEQFAMFPSQSDAVYTMLYSPGLSHVLLRYTGFVNILTPTLSVTFGGIQITRSV